MKIKPIKSLALEVILATQDVKIRKRKPLPIRIEQQKNTGQQAGRYLIH